jgi:hypothetical protein
MPYASDWLPRVLYHELGHVAYSKSPDRFPYAAWSAINPQSFSYAKSLASGTETHDFENEVLDMREATKNNLQSGFVSDYAQQSIEEDFCEISSQLFLQPATYGRFQKSAIRVYHKCEMALEFWNKVAPGVGDFVQAGRD